MIDILKSDDAFCKDNDICKDNDTVTYKI